jgi:hypothetical protein
MKNSSHQLPKEYAYLFLFQDKFGNEITSVVKNCWSKQDAIKIANNLLANTSHLDIVKIKTKRNY